jgi:hypothetical protein
VGTPLQELPVSLRPTLLEPPPGLRMRFGWAEEPQGPPFFTMSSAQQEPRWRRWRTRIRAPACTTTHPSFEPQTTDRGNLDFFGDQAQPLAHFHTRWGTTCAESSWGGSLLDAAVR